MALPIVLAQLFGYADVTVGILGTPSQVTHPNGRIDQSSDYDASMGGPRTTIVDVTSATPEIRYATYDVRGSVTETGEQDRFAEHFGYDVAGHLYLTRHRMDKNSPWIDKYTSYRDGTGVQYVRSVTGPFGLSTGCRTAFRL